MTRLIKIREEYGGLGKIEVVERTNSEIRIHISDPGVHQSIILTKEQATQLAMAILESVKEGDL